MGNQKLLTFTWLILACCSSCRQSQETAATIPRPEYRLARLHYENSTGEKGVTHFYYTPEGHNHMAIWQLEDSSRSSLNQHTLDSAGRLLVKSRVFSDGITSVQHFKYGKQGQLLSEDFSRSDSVTGVVDYTYDEDGRLLEADCRGLNGWFFGTIIYTWKDGIKTAAELIRDSVSIGEIVYEYDGDMLVREHWDFNGNWNQTFRYEYQQALSMTYTSSNVFIREDPWFRIRSEYYEFNGESGGPSYYHYNDSGKLVQKEYIRSDGLRTVTAYQYDPEGLLDLSLREYADGRSTDFLYWYSVDRKLLVRTFQGSDGSSGSETYRYENGLPLRGEWVNVDGWLNGTFEFHHDESGILRSAGFSGQDGMDAKLSFSYDHNYNLLKILWEFNRGFTQVYTFDYTETINQ
jgi:hypothetical protein